MTGLEKYLLVSLSLVFVFVFLRWLKRYLRRNEIQESFPYVYPFGKNALSGVEALRVELPQKTQVHVQVLSASGQLVRELPSAEFAQGEHSLPLDCRGLEPGAYELCIRFNNQMTTRSFVVA